MAQKEIHAILTETLGEHAHSYATIKNWLAQFKRGDFSTCDAPRPERTTTVATQEIIDQIHELILEDRCQYSFAKICCLHSFAIIACCLYLTCFSDC